MESVFSSEETDFLAEKRTLFQKALDLTSKFKAKVFIIVSEIDNPSEYWGSVDFVKEFHTTGLKVRSHDVEIFPAMSSDIYLDLHTTLDSAGTSEDHQVTDSIEPDEMEKTELSKHENSSNTTLHSTLASEDHQETYKSMESDETERKLSIHGNEATHFVRSEDSSTDTDVEANDFAMETSESESDIVSINEKDSGKILENEVLPESMEVQNKKLEINDNDAGCSKTLANQKLVRKKMTIEERVSRISRLFEESYKSKPYSCDKCGKWFVTCAAWKVHLSEATCSKRKCRHCHIGFLMHKELQEHKLQNHPIKIPLYVCKICDKDFLYSCFLRSHRVKEHGLEQKIYKCDVCEKEFFRSGELREHKFLHEEMKYTCSICGKKLPTVKMLSTHEDQHRKTYECEICNRKYSAAINVKQHIKRDHTKEGLLKCPTCQKSFLTNYELGYHLAITHDQFDELVSCEHCGKLFKHPAKLRAHVKTWHMVSIPVQCEVCGKQFRNKSQLRGHLAVHSDKKEECPICHKLFNLKQSLKKHLMVHSDDKPWQCHVCGYRCKLKENLGKHMRVHQKDNSC